MSLAQFLRDKTFDPATVDLISRTFERVCAELSSEPQDAALEEAVARKIIELVDHGVVTPTALYFATMAAFNLKN
jgi:hypothetical protein